MVTCASLKHQWQREIQRFADERAVVISGGRSDRRAAFEADAPYKMLNYELTWHELAQLKNLDADILVLDEAQRAKISGRRLPAPCARSRRDSRSF